MQTTFEIASLVATFIRLIVDEPDLVDVEVATGEYGILITARLSSSDVGKLIGRGGRTATSLRVLLSAIGKKARIRVRLDIQEAATVGLPIGSFISTS